MKILGIGIMICIFSLSVVNAGIGFGLTDTRQELVMAPDEDRACISYYLFNPGTIDIDGYLDIDREKGAGLNKIMGLTKLYEELSKLEAKSKVLSEEYKATVERGESTFEVEKKQAELSAESAIVNAKITKKKPQNTVFVPAGTRAMDENGNYQIPIEICFDRPTKTYLWFFEIGDTDFCGEHKGEILGRFNPAVSQRNAGGIGSAVVGSRAVELTIRLQCDVFEKGKAQFKFGLIIAAIFAILILLILWIRKGITKRRQQVQW